MVQRKVIVRGATNQALDELDAADIPDLSAAYEAAGGIATHAADTSSVHGITDSTVLATDAEVATAVGDHSADTTAVHGIADTAALSLTSHDHDADYEAAGGIATHAAAADPHAGYLKESDFDDIDFLVGTATGHTAAEIAVGTTPGGELGGTWAAPTVDATHSGSTHGAAVTTHEGAADPHTAYQKESEKSAASGYASLDAGTKVPIAELPTGTTGTTVALGDAAAALDATHAGAADPHTGYRLESADHSHATTGLQGGTVAHTALTSVGANDHHAQAHTHPAEGAVVVTHASTTGQGVNDHHAQAHAADHLPTGTDAVNKFSQAGIGTADLAIANTETVVVAKTFAAAELTAGMTFMFKAYATRAGTTSASPIIRIRIGTTTLTGNIAATLTPPVNTLAVGNSIEGMVTIRSAGAGGTALGSLMHTVHLAAVTITESLGVSTATVAVDTTAANQKVELTFISGNAANTYTWRNAVIYRVA